MLFLLAGCGSESNTSVPKQYTGVWSGEQSINQVLNERYILIEGNGTITYYDYLGDSYDQGQNCFIITKQANLAPIEGNIFEYIDSGNVSWVKLSITDNILSFLLGDVGSTFDSSGSFGIVYKYKSTNTNKSDLTPLCQA